MGICEFVGKQCDITFLGSLMIFILNGKRLERQKKDIENNKKLGLVRSIVCSSVLTWFLGCDIDYAALWTHSCTVIGPQGYVVGPAALQIPDDY